MNYLFLIKMIKRMKILIFRWIHNLEITKIKIFIINNLKFVNNKSLIKTKIKNKYNNYNY